MIHPSHALLYTGILTLFMMVVLWPRYGLLSRWRLLMWQSKRFKLVDLPGTYSLFSTSTDEEIARNFILFGRPDVTVVVADVARLERNLNLVLQILAITDRAVLCLNLMDEAKCNQLIIDERRLAKELGIPVIPTAARQKQGLDQLLQAISEMSSGALVCKPRRIRGDQRNFNIQ